MKLRALMKNLEVLGLTGDDHIEIKGIAYHSSNVQEGYLFVAVRGLKADGHRFIQEALDRGAIAVVQEMEPESGKRGPARIWVKDSRKALANIATAFYGDPSTHLKIIGITGTNGKTTTSYLIESILKKAGINTGLIGTINYRFGETFQTPSTTTPESLELQRILREMLDCGVSHVILEVSSHALDLQRVWGCHFDIAVFTNLSQDHLDYHGEMERYFHCKKRLFSQFLKEDKGSPKAAVINIDDPMASRIIAETPCKVIGYGLQSGGEIQVLESHLDLNGISAKVQTPSGRLHVVSQLMGKTNLYNILAAIGVSIEEKIDLSPIQEGISELSGVPGRLEKIPNDEGLKVFIDYAHTSDALERTLSALRPMVSGWLICVFGCGGDRDHSKRALMGEVAARLSDLIIVTTDNPRTESPEAIIKEIEKGFSNKGMIKYSSVSFSSLPPIKGYILVEDRQRAIELAISWARPEDIVLIAGKGHEDYQIIGNEKVCFNDKEEAFKALKLRRRPASVIG